MMVDRTNAERQRRYIARLKAGVSNAGADAEITRLTAELAQARARIAELEAATQKGRASSTRNRTRRRRGTKPVRGAKKTGKAT
jgi:hypothetical protein